MQAAVPSHSILTARPGLPSARNENRRMKRFTGAFLLAFVLTACGGSQNLPVPAGANETQIVQQGGAPKPTARGVGTLVLTLPPIVAPGVSIPWASSPQLLAAGTRSLVVTAGKKTYGPFRLSASTAGCSRVAAGLACSVSIRMRATLGEELYLTTHHRVDGTGLPLAFSQFAQNIYAGQQTFQTPVMTGIAHGLGVATLDKQLVHGQWTAERIAAYGIDAAGHVIPSANAVTKKLQPLPYVTVTYAGFLSGTLTEEGVYPTTKFPCCGLLPVAFPYDGLKTGTETFTISATGYLSHTGSIAVVPGNTGLATLLTTSSSLSELSVFNGQYLAQFPLNASGNVMPERAFFPLNDNAAVFGEDAKGNFWAGATHYANTGEVIGTLNLAPGEMAEAKDSSGNVYTIATSGYPNTKCSVFEYPANRFGTVVPIREVDYSCGYGAIAVDAAGDIFAADSVYVEDVGATVSEYPAGSGSGTLAPSRVVAMPVPGAGNFSDVLNVDVDDAGNLYVLDGSFPTTTLYEFAPASATPTVVPVESGTQNFAVDDSGKIYTSESLGNSTYALEVYAAGSSTPAQVLQGPLTEIDGSGLVAVPRTWSVPASRRR